MAAADLLTLDQLRAAYPGLSAEQLADAPQLIAAVSAEIAGRRPRAAARATYDETHDPGVTRVLQLKRRPVIRVNRVRADMAAALTLAYSGAARRANAEVVTTGEVGAQTATALSLTTEAGGATAEALFDFGTYPTLTQLATAATGQGWTAAAAPGQGDMASADLEPGQGPRSAKTMAVHLWGYTRDLDDYRLEPRGGELHIYEWRAESYSYPDRAWGTDPRATTLRVLYDAGTGAPRPDVTRAAILIVGALLESTDKPGIVQSVSSEVAGYRLADPTYRFPDQAERILSRYKDRRFN